MSLTPSLIFFSSSYVLVRGSQNTTVFKYLHETYTNGLKYGEREDQLVGPALSTQRFGSL